MSRIDAVAVELYVADEFEGHRTIRFDVPLPDDDFVAAVAAKWHEYSERLLAAARAGSGPIS